MKKKTGHFPLPILLLSLLFAVKALYLAFCVTPLWGAQDESAHYAYVQDIADGRGIPLLGKAVIGSDIMSYVEKRPDAPPAYNWIAQHPPLYYIIAAIPLKIGENLTNDVEILYRLPRIVAALSGALLILVLFRTFCIAGVDATRATAIAASVGFIPMISNLASVTNHDIPLFLCCSVATYFFACYITHRKILDTYWCSAWLAIAGGIKMMTPLALTVPMIAMLLFELRGPVKYWLKHAIGLSILAISIPSIWLIRNKFYFNSFFYTSGTDRKPEIPVPLNDSFASYLHSQPVFENFISSFYGLFGFDRSGPPTMMFERDLAKRNIETPFHTIGGLPFQIFSLLIFIIGCVCIYYLFILLRNSLKEKDKSSSSSIIGSENFYFNSLNLKKSPIGLFLIIAFLMAIFIGITTYPSGIMRDSAISSSIFLGFFSLILVFYTSCDKDRMVLYGFIIFLFFGGLLLYHVYDSYLINGHLVAIQGRYLFPVIPAALLSLSIIVEKQNTHKNIINLIAIILLCTELAVFTLQVLPFYVSEG